MNLLPHQQEILDSTDMVVEVGRNWRLCNPYIGAVPASIRQTLDNAGLYNAGTGKTFINHYVANKVCEDIPNAMVVIISGKHNQNRRYLSGTDLWMGGGIVDYPNGSRLYTTSMSNYENFIIGREFDLIIFDAKSDTSVDHLTALSRLRKSNNHSFWKDRLPRSHITCN